MHIFISIYILSYIHILTYIYLNLHIYIYIYTHTYIQIHTQTNPASITQRVSLEFGILLSCMVHFHYLNEMVKALDCGIVVRKYVLQSRYYVHFWANTLGKGMSPLILPAMG